MIKHLLTALFIFSIFLQATELKAITIDEFEEVASSDANSANPINRVQVAGTKVIGLGRTLTALNTEGTLGVSIDQGFGLFSFSIKSGSKGRAEIVWDGNIDPNSLIANGLGGIDFTQDMAGIPTNERAIIVPVVANDLPNAQIELRIYDIFGDDSTIVKTVNQVDFNNPASFVNLQFKFTEFTGIDFTRIGAVRLRIIDEVANRDITIAGIKTNGVCNAITDQEGDVIDSCNICNGDPDYKLNKCFDCKNVPFGPAKIDQCNVCDGDGTSCLDCANVPFGTSKIDQCNVCGGDGTSCLDCFNTPFGTSKIDQCNVCGGDGTSCLDCANVPFGASKIDACNICGGTATDPNQCVTNQCVTVEASAEILAFEKRLIEQAKTITKKFREEDKRNKRNSCGINSKPSSSRVNKAFETIKNAGNEIFTKGVEICGEGCVTVSFAEQVTALTPVLKTIEKETTSLARKVQKCYKRKKIKTTQSIAGVQTTIKNVTNELTQLIKDCKDKQVCK